MMQEMSKQAKDLSLFQLSETVSSKCLLMPGHWMLYEKLQELATEKERLILGRDLPIGSEAYCDDLIEKCILTYYPITYEKWLEMEDIRDSLSGHSVADDFNGGISVEDEVYETKNDGGNDSVEVDLDFLD